MNKDQIIVKLKEMGIQSENCFPKSSFLQDSIPVVGLYEREMMDTFYFYNTYDEKIHSFKAEEGEEIKSTYQQDPKTKKYLVPLSQCPIVWEDKEFVELPDKFYKDMTLREHACIELKVPESGLPWLDTLIRKSIANDKR